MQQSEDGDEPVVCLSYDFSGYFCAQELQVPEEMFLLDLWKQV